MAEKKILIVEDDKNIRNLMSITLKKHGYQTINAQNGFEALTILDGMTPDLILTDIMMPELNGLDLIKAIQNRPETSKIPIIICSVQDTIDDVVKGLTLGAIHYCTKPIKLNELVAHIKVALKDF